MKLILILSILAGTCAWASDSLTDADLSREFMTVAKDAEVGSMIEGTSQFQQCLEANKFVASDDTGERQRKAATAQTCFREKISSSSNAQNLENLSRQLNLQSYGLLQSNSSKELANYLSNKVYEQMTGVDLAETNHQKLIEQMKFKNKKMVDQADFVKMYKSRLGKNALYEVSRFCFNDLRKSGTEQTNASSFAAYWNDEIQNDWVMQLSQLTDSGSPRFGQTLTGTDRSGLYETIQQGISADMAPKAFEGFFNKCMLLIDPMCKQYEQDRTKPGSKACLSKARLQAMRKALADVEKVQNDFETMSGSQLALQLDNNAIIKRYQGGTNDGETSLDTITNLSSADVLQDLKKNAKAERCLTDSVSEECKRDFIVVGESLNQTLHGIDQQSRMEEEVTQARVKAMKDDKASLREYLESNGYFDLLNNIENKTTEQLEAEIKTIFEARRVAATEEIRNRLKSRQVTENEVNTDDKLSSKITENINSVNEERGRLAQVVMFNNIVTSYLELSKEDKTSAGKNANAINSELAGMRDSNIETDLFSNIQESFTSNERRPANESMDGFGIIDTILGKQD